MRCRRSTCVGDYKVNMVMDGVLYRCSKAQIYWCKRGLCIECDVVEPSTVLACVLPYTVLTHVLRHVVGEEVYERRFKKC